VRPAQRGVLGDEGVIESREFPSQGIALALAELFSLPMPVRVMNPPSVGRGNYAKLLHASACAIDGWAVPRSCQTSSPADAERFLVSCENGAIAKGCSSTKTWVMAVTDVHSALLPRVAASPVLFQERVIGPDVRVHVVGDRLFAEQIATVEIDYRRARKVAYAPISVPQTIATAIARLQVMFGAPLLGLDFKVDARSGQWFFLEANSLPAYHGYDTRAHYAISDAIVDWLRLGQGWPTPPLS
jgi:hypothetical protein